MSSKSKNPYQAPAAQARPGASDADHLSVLYKLAQTVLFFLREGAINLPLINTCCAVISGFGAVALTTGRIMLRIALRDTRAAVLAIDDPAEN